MTSDRLTLIQAQEDARAFLQEPLKCDGERWLADQVCKNLDASIRGISSNFQSEIYAVGIGMNPRISYAYGNLNTESTQNTCNAKPPAPELTSRFVSRTWTALTEGFFVLGENNADNEEKRLLDWCDEFAERYPADLDVEHPTAITARSARN